LQRYRDQQARGVALFEGIMPSLAQWAARFDVAAPARMG